MCSHVVAEHYHSFRIVRTVVDADEAVADASAAAAEDAAAIPPAVRVTHDYLMECVLCGKGCHEQRIDHGASADAGAAASSVTGPTAALPSFSLSTIQINEIVRGSCPPGSSMPAPAAAESKEEDEWAE